MDTRFHYVNKAILIIGKGTIGAVCGPSDAIGTFRLRFIRIPGIGNPVARFSMPDLVILLFWLIGHIGTIRVFDHNRGVRHERLTAILTLPMLAETHLNGNIADIAPLYLKPG